MDFCIRTKMTSMHLTETNPNKRDKNVSLFDMNSRDRKSGCEVQEMGVGVERSWKVLGENI